MAVELSQIDFQYLVQIVQSLPEFTNVRDRVRLVSGSLEGVKNSRTIIARLDLDGSPMGVSVDVIRFLSNFGQVAYGKEALGIFINYIYPFLPASDANYIDNLRQRYSLDTPISVDLPIGNWLGDQSYAQFSEKIIGENTLKHIYILEQALDAARSVVHIKIRNSNGNDCLGTGFLITPQLLMTNNHVVSNFQQAISAEFTFYFQLDKLGKQCNIVTVRAEDDVEKFYTNKDLDFSIIPLENPPTEAGLKLRSALAIKDSRVTIVQHPGGHLKKISLQNNFVAYADKRIVQYTTSTLPGSSGSPVFNDDFEVIAIHHSGGLLIEPVTKKRYLCNAGTSMITILQDIEKNFHNLLLN